MNRFRSCSLLLVVFLGTSFAQNTDDHGAVIINSARASTIPTRPTAGPDLRSPMLYQIYSNLGHRKGNCYGTEGWTVGLGTSIAMPFTPKADAKATELVLGLFSVTTGYTTAVSLNEDSNGMPGKVIHKWRLKKLGTSHFHDCSATITRSRKGLPLKAGTQYWAVASAPDAAWDIWDFTYSGLMGNFASEQDGQGWNADYGNLGAFGVFGAKLK